MKYIASLAVFFLLIPTLSHAASVEKISLPVPFLWEIPDGVWVAPWSGACEEASIIAVENFYLKKPKAIIKKVEAKNQMLPLFSIETKIFGYNSDTNAAENLKLINDYTSFDAKIIDNPTLEEIKDELRAGRPVISLHYGYDLKNPRHRFRRGGSSYHVMAIVGFDDAKGEFLANDSELPDGIDFHYKYATIMDTLHDFDHKTKHADGPPRVLFTKPKTIVKANGSNKIFLLRDNKKYYISNPAVFKNHRWSWSLVKTVDKSVLSNLESGSSINN
ncbi:MAG: C39 family peptidase [Patescibacteria group bacterium]|jgi:hypothetical protein